MKVKQQHGINKKKKINQQFSNLEKIKKKIVSGFLFKKFINFAINILFISFNALEIERCVVFKTTQQKNLKNSLVSN